MKNLDDDMKSEYDFSKGRRSPYAERIARAGSNLVVIEPEIFALFPSSEKVNDALRMLVKAGAKAVKSGRPAKKAS